MTSFSPSNPIPLFKVHMPESVMGRLKEVLFSGFVNEGIQVLEFEKALREIIKNQKTLATNSATSSLTLALKLAGVGPDSEVISSPMTCVASNTPISNLFAKPVWCDINPRTGNMDPRQIESKITPRTKAILFVDWTGIPADAEEIMAIGRRHKIKVIEDAAHAFGARYKGRPIGNSCDYTAFSFQAIKHLTTGDGGALSCLDEADFVRAKKLKWFGIDREATKDEAGNWRGSRWGCDIDEAGYKFHMNNIDAAIVLSQIPLIDDVLRRHRENAQYFLKNLSGIKGLTFPEISEDTDPSWWVFMLFAERRDDLIKLLAEHGIHASLLHVRNDVYKCFEGCEADLPGVSLFEKTELCIPCGWWVTPEAREFIVDVIKKGW